MGAAPCTAMSFTQWFTRSAPTVWCRFISKAIFSLVPTPSTLETRTGSEILLLVDGEEPAEAADLAQHPAIEGLMGKILDALLGAISTLDVHASVGVGDGAGFCRLLCQESGSSSEDASPQIFTREEALYHSSFSLSSNECFHHTRRRRERSYDMAHRKTETQNTRNLLRRAPHSRSVALDGYRNGLLCDSHHYVL